MPGIIDLFFQLRMIINGPKSRSQMGQVVKAFLAGRENCGALFRYGYGEWMVMVSGWLW